MGPIAADGMDSLARPDVEDRHDSRGQGVLGTVRTLLIHEFVTGGGLAGADLPASWAAEGSAMRRALAEDFGRIPGLRVRMTLDSRLPDESGPWETVRIGPGEEVETFRDLAGTCDLTLAIAPETDGLLEARARWIIEAGGRSLGSTPDAIALAADKHRLGVHWQSQGVNSPPTRRLEPGAPAPVDGGAAYPTVLKPKDGAGSLDTFVLDGPDDFAVVGPLPGPMILQPWVEGEAGSASWLVDPAGRATFVGATRQRIERHGRSLGYHGGLAPMEIDEGPIRAALAAVPGLRGWVGVDFVRTSDRGTLAMIELNPRPTTSYVGLRRLFRPGALAAAWLTALADGAAGPDRLPFAEDRPRAVRFEPDGTVVDEVM